MHIIFLLIRSQENLQHNAWKRGSICLSIKQNRQVCSLPKQVLPEPEEAYMWFREKLGKSAGQAFRNEDILRRGPSAFMGKWKRS